MSKLKGKTAIITGAGRGIGRAIALKLANEGANIVVNDLDEAPANDTVALLQQAGVQALAVPGSIADPAVTSGLVDSAVTGLGGIDIIVNNAGYTWDSVIQKMTDEQWQAMVDVHLTGPFRLLRAAQPVFRELNREDALAGRRQARKVVNISSIAGLGGNTGQVNYAAAKAGITGMTKTLAKEWGRINVTVNCVAFGFIKTRLTEATANQNATVSIEGRDIKVGLNPDLAKAFEQTIPLGRAGTPEEAAGAVYLFCAPESDYITGQTVICGGGLTI